MRWRRNTWFLWIPRGLILAAGLLPLQAAWRPGPVHAQQDPTPLDQALDEYGARVEDTVAESRRQMSAVRTETDELFFQMRSAFGLKNAFSQGEKELERVRDRARRSVTAGQGEARDDFAGRGFRVPDFASDLNRITQRGLGEVDFAYEGFRDWLLIRRRDVQLTFLEAAGIHVALLVVFQYDGVAGLSGQELAPDVNLRGSALARKASLEGRRRTVVTKLVDKDTDVIQAIREARLQAEAILEGLDGQGEVLSVELFGHGVPGGGLRLPRPIEINGDAVETVGGFRGAAPRTAACEATGRFLGAIGAALGSEGTVTYYSGFSAGSPQEPGRRRRDIATLTASITGRNTRGIAGSSAFVARDAGASHTPPGPAQDGTSSEVAVSTDQAKKIVNDTVTLIRRARRALDAGVRQGEVEVRRKADEEGQGE